MAAGSSSGANIGEERSAPSLLRGVAADAERKGVCQSGANGRHAEPPTAVDQARALVQAAERIVVVTGAGISTDSGIPDFRGPNGLWTTNPGAEKASSLQHYLGDVDVRRASWQARLRAPVWSAEPNAGHRAIVELERHGRLRALVTQNTDELHQRAGSDPDLVVEVHGTDVVDAVLDVRRSPADGRGAGAGRRRARTTCGASRAATGS